VAPATALARAAAAARSAPSSGRPRSTAEYSHHHERPNQLTGHARPGHLNKIVLRALWPCEGDVAKSHVIPRFTIGCVRSTTKRVRPTQQVVRPDALSGKEARWIARRVGF
jgi:hypothetical protein